MIEIKVIRDIFINGIGAIKTDSDGRKINRKFSKIVFFILWFILPFAVTCIVFYQNIKLSFFQNFVGSSVALFTGLFFSLLLRIGDKIRAEKNNKNKDIENFIKFKESLHQISKISQLIIFLGIIIFVMLVLNGLLKSDSYPIIELIITSASLVLLVWYLLALLSLIQRFTFTMKDEIENIL